MLTVGLDFDTGLGGNDQYNGMAVEGKLRNVVKLAVQSITVCMCMTVIPQLMSHVLQNCKSFHKEMGSNRATSCFSAGARTCCLCIARHFRRPHQ